MGEAAPSTSSSACICFLLTATLLLGMGVWLLLESLLKLVRAERPSIGPVVVAGRPLWAGGR